MLKSRVWPIFLLAILFIAAGLNHFFNHAFYLKMMPSYLPWPAELVCCSGIAEILLGVAVVPLRTRQWAGYGLILLLIAVFPANLNMALNSEQFPTALPAVLWARLPLQGVLIWIVYKVTKTAVATLTPGGLRARSAVQS